MKRLLKHKVISGVLGSAVMLLSTALWAETAVIVNPANDAPITSEDVAKLYLGKTKSFPNGKAATPVERGEGSAIRVGFLEKIVDKSESQMKAYWSRLIFTGKGVPPNAVDTDKEMKELVAKDPGAIGYIDVTSVDDTVKVVLTF